MEIILAFLVLILLSISILHFYWALGGSWGFRKALPMNENGEPLFIPKKIHSAIVGIGLLGILGLLYLRINNSYFPTRFEEVGLWIIGGIFILRSIGDFKYVGFFKNIRSTDFGKLDTMLYSPLCLFIGCSIIWIEYSIPHYLIF